jgi:hypothetical protein
MALLLWFNSEIRIEESLQFSPLGIARNIVVVVVVVVVVISGSRSDKCSKRRNSINDEGDG